MGGGIVGDDDASGYRPTLRAPLRAAYGLHPVEIYRST